MRIDVHTHIFPSEMVNGRDRFFPGEPAFRLLYESPKARLVTAETLLEAMDEDEVDRAVVFGFPWENGDLAARHNDYVLEAAHRFAPRLIPLACMSPLGKGSLREAERCLQAGARGLGELAVYGTCDTGAALDGFRDLIECCRAHGGILSIHANEPVGHIYPGKVPLGPDFYYALARLAAGMPLILAHWGGGLCFYELLRKEVREALAQVYYDTAASPFLYHPAIYKHMIGILGRDKILFGSDYPLLSPGRYIREMEEAQLAPEEVRAVLGENAERLFNVS